MKKYITKVNLIFSIFVLLVASSSAQTRASSPDFNALVKSYTAAWKEADPVKRDKLLTEVFAPNAVYIDSQVEIKGRQKLMEHIGLAMQVYPSNRTMDLSKVESHHGNFRFAWRSAASDGTLLSEGMGFGEVNKNGVIRRLVTFTGPLVPTAQSK